MIPCNIAFIMQCIRSGKFTWEQDWKRGWNAQPKPNTRYFVGRVKANAGISYNLKWVPQSKTLTLWTLSKQSSRQVEKRTARALTKLITTQI